MEGPTSHIQPFTSDEIEFINDYKRSYERQPSRGFTLGAVATMIAAAASNQFCRYVSPQEVLPIIGGGTPTWTQPALYQQAPQPFPPHFSLPNVYNPIHSSTEQLPLLPVVTQPPILPPQPGLSAQFGLGEPSHQPDNRLEQPSHLPVVTQPPILPPQPGPPAQFGLGEPSHQPDNRLEQPESSYQHLNQPIPQFPTKAANSAKMPRANSRKSAKVPVYSVHPNASSGRRKNVYLPNIRTGKALWKARTANAPLIELAIGANSISQEVKDVVKKEYTQNQFEQLPPSDQGHWNKIAEAVQQFHECFRHVAPEERKVMVQKEFSFLHECTVNAFKVVPFTVNFLPGYGTIPGHPDFMVTIPNQNQKDFVTWLLDEHPVIYDHLLDVTKAYSMYLWQRPSQRNDTVDDASQGEEEIISSEEEEEPPEEKLPLSISEIRDGIRIFPGLSKSKSLNVPSSRKIYKELLFDRYKRAGYVPAQSRVRTLDWAGIQRRTEGIVYEQVVPKVRELNGELRPAKMAPPNTMNKIDLDAWLAFFAKHQDTTDDSVSWEDGMLFKPNTLVNAKRTFQSDGDDYLCAANPAAAIATNSTTADPTTDPADSTTSPTTTNPTTAPAAPASPAAPAVSAAPAAPADPAAAAPTAPTAPTAPVAAAPPVPAATAAPATAAAPTALATPAVPTVPDAATATTAAPTTFPDVAITGTTTSTVEPAAKSTRGRKKKQPVRANVVAQPESVSQPDNMPIPTGRVLRGRKNGPPQAANAMQGIPGPSKPKKRRREHVEEATESGEDSEGLIIHGLIGTAVPSSELDMPSAKRRR